MSHVISFTRRKHTWFQYTATMGHQLPQKPGEKRPWVSGWPPTHESTRSNRSGDGRVKLTGTESTVSPGKSRFLRRRSIYHKPQPGCSVLKSRKHNFMEFSMTINVKAKQRVQWSHCNCWQSVLGWRSFSLMTPTKWPSTPPPNNDNGHTNRIRMA